MDGLDSLLVFEDDAELCLDFFDRVEEFLRHLPNDWEGIMLGGQHHSRPYDINNHVVKAINVQRTHAYIARGNYLRALHNRWADSPVHIDWRMRDWQHIFNVYCPRTWLVAQREGHSDILGRVKRLETWSSDPSVSYSPDRKAPVFLLKVPPDVLSRLRGLGIHTGYWRDRKSGLDRGLIDIFNKADESFEAKFQRWYQTLATECRRDGLILGVYHPLATLEAVRKVIPHVQEIETKTLEEAIEKIFPKQ